MKKHILVVFFSFIICLAYSQSPEKALKLAKDGKYAEAVTEVEEAMKSEKNQKKEKSWYSRGEVYYTVLLNSPETDEDAAVKAKESFTKAKELSKEGSIYHNLANLKLNEAGDNLLNLGATAYQEEKYESALELFKKAALFRNDTLTASYAGYAAKASKKYPEAAEYYKKAIDLGKTDADIYLDLIGLLASSENPEADEAEALKMAEEGVKKNPDSKNLRQTEINLLLRAKRFDEAVDRLEKAVAENPDNADHHFMIGALYAEKGENDLAVANYKKALEVAPDHFNANFNMGVLYYNKGAEYTTKANGMDLATYQKEGKKLEEKVKEEFKKALPYFEKAYSADSSDPYLSKSLNTVYEYLKIDESARVNK